MRIDQTRPVCLRCSRLGLSCGGYREPFRHGHESTSAAVSASAYSGRSTPLSSENDDEGSSISKALVSRSRRLRHSRSPMANETVPDTLNLTAFGEELYISYTYAHLFRESDREPSTLNPYSIPGIATFRRQALSEKCLLALSLSFFGIEHGQWDISKRGMQLYGVALKELNEALGDPLKVQSIEVLESVTLLSMYEVSNPLANPFGGATPTILPQDTQANPLSHPSSSS